MDEEDFGLAEKINKRKMFLLEGKVTNLIHFKLQKKELIFITNQRNMKLIKQIRRRRLKKLIKITMMKLLNKIIC